MEQTLPQLVLGLDVDGVLADYEAGFRLKVAQMLGVDASTIGRQTCWSLPDSNWPIRSEEHFAALHSAAVLSGMFRQLDPIDGASEGVWALSNAGVRVRIVTHRLGFHGTHGVAAQDTAVWLDRANIPYRDLVFVADKPSVDAHVFVDDAPHNIRALREAGAYTIVFDQLYNRDAPGPRAHSWDEVVALVRAYAEENGFAYNAQAPALERNVFSAA